MRLKDRGDVELLLAAEVIVNRGRILRRAGTSANRAHPRGREAVFRELFARGFQQSGFRHFRVRHRHLDTALSNRRFKQTFETSVVRMQSRQVRILSDSGRVSDRRPERA